MSRRYVAIWFRYLTADRLAIFKPELKDIPFVLAAPERGRMVVQAVSKAAVLKGIAQQMAVADARAICPELQVFDHKADQAEKLLNKLAEWALRYTPAVSVDLPDGLLLDVSGCAHLWGGERPYLRDIYTKLTHYGYHIRLAIADTVGAAWAVSRYGRISAVVPTAQQAAAIGSLPPAALRLPLPMVEKLQKLGLYRIESFMNMQRSALRRRFASILLTRLDQALGKEIETLTLLKPVEPYQQRLPCAEPLTTRRGIEIALEKLLDTMCKRLAAEEKGVRQCVFSCYCVNGNIQQIQIGTTAPSRDPLHLFRLFELKMQSLAPGLGFELFLLEVPRVQDFTTRQEAFWHTKESSSQIAVATLLDRIAQRIGAEGIKRFLPQEHYLPERSVKATESLQEEPDAAWYDKAPRPLHLLPSPEPIEVMVAMPDYPPNLFRYRGVVHRICKADGPERIEQEWWIQPGAYRDYYCVEDEAGRRYWLFRLGDYKKETPEWFIHGFFP